MYRLWSSCQAPAAVLLVVVCCTAFVTLRAQDRPASSQTSEPAPTTTVQAAGHAANDAGNSAPSKVASGSALQLAVGDLVQMTVYNVPELTTKTRISSKGEIYCPLIGYVHVSGLTTEQAQNAIEEQLANFVKDPHVTLFVSEYASEGASVLGEVMKPGIYPVLGPQHLFDLISAAGGLTEKAGRSLTVTHRSDPDHPVTVQLPRNLADNSETNVPVYPGDTVIVRKADIIYVVGDVQRPSGLLMDSGGLTVLQALALAGGTNRTAKMNGVKILRKTPTGMTETSVALKKILQAKAPDISLEPNDILVIPSSTGKIMAGRTLEAAIQAATLVSVAAVP
jgi:polysaccharide biosynthesis/export protein